MLFLNETHKYNFIKLFNETTIKSYDNERIPLIYIIAGNSDLFKKKYYIYNLKNNTPNISCLKNINVDFCTSSKSLIRLGFNLFNGYYDENTNPLHLLFSLNKNNYKLAINAMKIRFEILN